MSPKRRTCIAFVLGCAIVASVLSAAVGATPASAAPNFGAAATAPIHPGVQMITGNQLCTANFVFTNGAEAYIGYAAHCAGTDGDTATNGCTAGSLPYGTPVRIGGAKHLGTLVYSSWLVMQKVGEKDRNACQYNDLGLVRIDPADVPLTSPTVPHWGGPTGVAASTRSLESVVSYQNSSLRLGIALLSPKRGYSLGTSNGGWTQNVYTVTPGIPGDSGSGFMNRSGQAFGVLSTGQYFPLALSNGIGSLKMQMDYARSHGVGNLRLALGQVPFHV